MENFGEDGEMKNVFDGVESIKEEFFTAGGPGGSGKDTSNTAVRLRAKISDEALLGRLLELYSGSVTDTGEFLVECQEERGQHQNRARTYEILTKRLEIARQVPKERIETKPSRSAKEKRLTEKKKRGEIKRERKKIDTNER